MSRRISRNIGIHILKAIILLIGMSIPGYAQPHNEPLLVIYDNSPKLYPNTDLPGPPGRLVKAYYPNGDIIYLDDSDLDNPTYRKLSPQSTSLSSQVSNLIKASELVFDEAQLLFMTDFHDEAPISILLLRVTSKEELSWLSIWMPHPDIIKPTDLWAKAKAMLQECDGTLANPACRDKQVIPTEKLARTLNPSSHFFELMDIVAKNEEHGSEIKPRYVEFFLQPISDSFEDMEPTFTWPVTFPDKHSVDNHNWGRNLISVFVQTEEAAPALRQLDSLYVDGKRNITNINGEKFLITTRIPFPFEEQYPR